MLNLLSFQPSSSLNLTRRNRLDSASSSNQMLKAKANNIEASEKGAAGVVDFDWVKTCERTR